VTRIVNLVVYAFLRRRLVPSAEARRLAELDTDWDDDARMTAIARAMVRMLPPDLSHDEIDALLMEMRRQLEDNDNEPR
jgi:hypothetical protein